VTLRVTTDAGLTATTSRTITISTTLPAGSANFTFSPTDPHAGDTVFFNASSSTVTGGSFSWDFGDGAAGSGVSTTHSYTNARTYTVNLTVTNSLGQTTTTSKTITVQ
jgi:PKD repeat protein